MNTFSKYILCLLSLLLTLQFASAQSDFVFEIEGDSLNIFQSGLKTEAITDSTKAISVCHARVLELQRDGYLLAGIDSTQFEDNRIKLKVYIGRRLNSIQLYSSDLSAAEAKKFSLSPKKLPKRIKLNELKSLKTGILDFQQNHGYPFAEVQLDSFKIQDNEMLASLRLQKGKLILFDSLLLSDRNIIKPEFLSRFLAIEKESAFNQEKIDNISNKLKHLPFLNLNGQPEIYFGLSKAKVNLDITERKLNLFDGIIGLVPGANGRDTELNGELRLELKNLFRSAKSLNFEWRRITTATQQLRFSYQHPLILSSPLNFEFRFDQLKEGSSFSNRSIFFGLDYLTDFNSRISFFYEDKNGNELDEITDEVGDFNLTNYGLGFKLNALDNLEFPKAGWLIDLNFQVGTKRLSANSVNLAAGESVRSNQYQMKLSTDKYWKLKPKSILYFNFSAGLIENQKLFLNDLFRLGGLTTIRGFNENVFFASEYLLGSIEWQIYFERNSYLFLFYDQSYIRTDVFNGSDSDQPAGLGLGLKMESGGGYFNLVYGLGRSNGEGFSFGNSKLHFGFTGRF